MQQRLAWVISAILAGAMPTAVFAQSEDDVRQLSFGGLRIDPLESAHAFRAGGKTQAGKALRLVQFIDTPRQEWRRALEQSGLIVLQYYPHNAYLVWGDDAASAAAESLPMVRWQGVFSADWKLSPDLKGRVGKIDNIQMLIYDDGSLNNVIAQIEAQGGELRNLFKAQPDGRLMSLIVSVDADKLAGLSTLPQVLWSEYVSPRAQLEDELSSQILAGNYNGANQVTAPGYLNFLTTLGATGSGVTWAVTDSGVDYSNPELSGRIVAGHDYAGCTPVAGNPGDDNSSGGHGTHVAGIIAGTGLVAGGADANLFHYGIGVAPQVNLVALNPICNGSVPWPPAGGWQELSKRAILLGATGTNNSWTSAEGAGIGYNATARTHDFMVRDGDFDTAMVNEPFVLVFSAGNSGPGASTITSPKEAKSPIVVGASQNQRVGGIDSMASFSSRGPAIDGRTLPTITTPGEQIASTRRVAGAAQCATAIGGGVLANYAFCSGTSMASPHAAGAAALLTQWWRGNNAGATPSPAMIKALLTNGAVDMGTADLPNNNEGWGRVHLPRSFGAGLSNAYIDQTERLDNVAQVFERTYGVPDSGQPVRITVAWTDAPGAAGANPALVNNLDLEVIAGGQTYRGNVFSAGQSTTGGSADNRNIVENVYLPAGVSAVTVRVIATALPGDGVPNVGDATDQDFALVCKNCALEPSFTLSMPTTAESICAGTDLVRTINVGQILGFSDPVDMSASGLPAPGVIGFSVDPINSLPGSTIMTAQTAGVAGGEYTITATGTSGTIIRSVNFPAFIATGAAATSNLSAPANSATNVPANTAFTWSAASEAYDYLIEVATDSLFTQIVRSGTTRSTTWTPAQPLETNTQYYWRVTSRNACAGGLPNAVFSDGFEGGARVVEGGSGSVSAIYGFVTVAAPGDCPVGSSSTIVLSEDFEGAATGWGQEAGGTGTNTWAITSNFPFGGTKALQGLTPVTASDQRYTSPAVNLPTVGNGLSLSFQSRQHMESRSGGCWDAGLLEVSVNGAAYTQVPNAQMLTDPYNGAIGSGNPATGLQGWCGDPQAYLKSVVDLTPYANNNNVRFRFRVTSDGSVARAEGWNVDNVEIKRCN